jgi:hypothetical protein
MLFIFAVNSSENPAQVAARWAPSVFVSQLGFDNAFAFLFFSFRYRADVRDARDAGKGGSGGRADEEGGGDSGGSADSAKEADEAAAAPAGGEENS